MASEIKLKGQSGEHFFHFSTLCAEEKVSAFAKTIREKGITKIVFAGCSPSQNQALLGEIASDAGLTPSAVK